MSEDSRIRSTSRLFVCSANEATPEPAFRLGLVWFRRCTRQFDRAHKQAEPNATPSSLTICSGSRRVTSGGANALREVRNNHIGVTHRCNT
eukprot:1175456-Prorocentrum_minimum.AAC.6